MPQKLQCCWFTKIIEDSKKNCYLVKECKPNKYLICMYILWAERKLASLAAVLAHRKECYISQQNWHDQSTNLPLVPFSSLSILIKWAVTMCFILQHKVARLIITLPVVPVVHRYAKAGIQKLFPVIQNNTIMIFLQYSVHNFIIHYSEAHQWMFLSGIVALVHGHQCARSTAVPLGPHEEEAALQPPSQPPPRNTTSIMQVA